MDKYLANETTSLNAVLKGLTILKMLDIVSDVRLLITTVPKTIHKPMISPHQTRNAHRIFQLGFFLILKPRSYISSNFDRKITTLAES